MKESPVQQRIRLAAAQNHIDLWRNNSGAYQDERGNFIRYGLCNDSAQLNERIKSSDLIGVTPIFITAEHIGRIVGVFTAIETKPSDWVFRESDKRAVAQKAFHDIVLKNGGYAGFATCVEDFKRIVKHEKY